LATTGATAEAEVTFFTIVDTVVVTTDLDFEGTTVVVGVVGSGKPLAPSTATVVVVVAIVATDA
jgi:hypothetical protein